MKRVILAGIVLAAALAAHAQVADDRIATMRLVPLDAEPEPPRIAEFIDSDERRARIHPMQPPTIPHKIDNYQVDLRANRCLSCHSRTRVEESRAPMVSVTHYTDRDGIVLAEVSPRRYFCTQCHAPQTDAKTLVDNTFEDVADMLSGGRSSE